MMGNFRIQEEANRLVADLPTAPYSGCESSFKPHPSECSSYLMCNNGDYEERACPGGLHWGQMACTWPQDAGCEGSGNNEIGDSRPPEYPPQPPPPVHHEEDHGGHQDHDHGMDMDGDENEYEPSDVPDTGNKVRRAVFKKYYVVCDTCFPRNPQVVCYFTNWAWYRQEQGKYTPDDIDPSLCTHVMYGFAVLDPVSLQMKPHDTWADLDNEFYRKVTDLKKKGVKVLIAIGGWNDSEGDKYSRLVSQKSSRSAFIEHALQFIEQYNFDGLDLDWEYPKCWQVNCDRGPPADKENFAAWVKELKMAFRPKGLLLTAAVSPSKTVIDQAYDVKTMSQ